MKLYTLNNIVRQALVTKGYPIHFFYQFLHYGTQCLRELQFDALRSIKTVRLPVNSYKAATLPCDYVDYVKIGGELGQHLVEFGGKDAIMRINNYDPNGNKVAYDDVLSNNGMIPNNWEGFWYTNYVNDKGEHLGKIFNNMPTFPLSFKVLRERNEIQLDSAFTGDEIVLEYITDGTSVDGCNGIHPYAIATIEAYINWKLKEHGRQYNLGERESAKNEYYNQLRILRGRMNNISIEELRRSLAVGYTAAIKN